jgi:hypothetical protein
MVSRLQMNLQNLSKIGDAFINGVVNISGQEDSSAGYASPERHYICRPVRDFQ